MMRNGLVGMTGGDDRTGDARTGNDGAALLERSAAGDPASFKRLYDTRAPRLHVLALHLLGRPELAADAVHDTLLRVWRHPDAVGTGDADARLFALLRYRAIDALRRRDGADAQEFGSDPDPNPDPGLDPVVAALYPLDETARRVLLHVLLRGATLSGLAGTLDLPLAAVKAGLRRALLELGASRAGPDPSGEQAARLLLAGGFVLCTLPPDERARVAAESAADPLLAADIAFWEAALHPLVEAAIGVAAPAAPPVSLWARIERSMNAPGVRTDPAPVRPRRADLSATIWKGVTAGSFLLAAVIAFVVLMDRTPMAVPMAALSRPGAPTPAFVVETRSDGAVQVMPLRPGEVPAGRALELWSESEAGDGGGAQPRSLGILPVSGLRLHRAMLPPGRSRLLVTLEPPGGSPTGLPTGPVLFGGALSLPD